MLAGDWVPEDTRTIDFDKLPRVPVEHAVVIDKHAEKGLAQHNYLVHHEGRFWAMWSDGPEIEDKVGQVVKYATSLDGMKWTAPEFLTPYPPYSGPDSPYYNTRSRLGMRYIARGFWVRGKQFLALASLDEAGVFFEPSLALHAFEWSVQKKAWLFAGVVQQNAINNFPPQILPNGQWGMSQRTFDYRKTGSRFLIGGKERLDRWQSVPVVNEKDDLKPEEPHWWTLPDGKNIMAMFRDNGGSYSIHRSFSTDSGLTWSRPVATNFPDAMSKFHGLRLKDGRYVLVSNPKPKVRDPMTIALSDDGMVFNKMFYVVGGRRIDYPHVMEHDGYLFIAHNSGKRSFEIERVSISDLDAMKMPARR